MKLTSKQRAALRKEANGIVPVFQIGKGGIDAPLVQASIDCLAKRELIKIKLLETCPVDARTAANILAGECKAEVVQVIGRVFVLFLRKKKDSEFREILKNAK